MIAANKRDPDPATAPKPYSSSRSFFFVHSPSTRTSKSAKRTMNSTKISPAVWMYSPILPKTRIAPSIDLDEQNSRPNYRRDIDGLRAVAILAVVAYHVFPGQAPGGFIGVDVFFVISGFLISTIIFKSLANRNFSFMEFYAHRVRRIFPALILVLAACLFFGWNILLANEFIYLGNHIAGSAGFIQNLLLWRESGYFDLASELKPLNHLWSLAIEEQFYLIFPLLLWCAWRLRINLLVVVGLICILSFAANVYATHHDPVGAFFSLQARAWELMIGAITARIVLDGAFQTSEKRVALLGLSLDSIISCFGLLLILIATFGLDKAVPYPGVLALLPVLGAALLLLSGPTAWANRFILSNPLPVFIGLISYPLYLWHWPLLSYLTIVDGEQPSLYQRSIVAALSFALAWLTYRYVEQPVRRNRFHARWTAIGLIAGMVVLMALGLEASHLYRSYDEQTQKIMQAWEFSSSPSAEGMYREDKFGIQTVGHNDKRKILFFGDSHLNQYIFMLGALQKKAASTSDDAPEIMFPPHSAEFLAKAIEDRTMTAAVFSYFWALMYYSEQVNQPIRCCGKGLMGTAGVRVKPLTEEQMDQKDAQLTRQISALRDSGKQVYLVLDNPFGEEFSPRSLVKRSFFHGITIASPPADKQRAIKRSEPVRSRIQKIARQTGARIIDPFAYLCDENSCPVLSADGLPINKDYDHLSTNATANHVRYLDVLFAPESTK
jgi:peptidoglycan/LPS O-acetylase OafA/YrhL